MTFTITFLTTMEKWEKNNQIRKLDTKEHGRYTNSILSKQAMDFTFTEPGITP